MADSGLAQQLCAYNTATAAYAERAVPCSHTPGWVRASLRLDALHQQLRVAVA